MPVVLAPKLTSHACALLIDNVGNYLYLNNGSFKFEVDPHQFNLRLHHFSQFQRKGRKKNQKLADMWLVGEMVNRIGIYGSKVAEGLSAFQRRSCLKTDFIHIGQALITGSGTIMPTPQCQWKIRWSTICLLTFDNVTPPPGEAMYPILYIYQSFFSQFYMAIVDIRQVFLKI